MHLKLNSDDEWRYSTLHAIVPFFTSIRVYLSVLLRMF